MGEGGQRKRGGAGDERLPHVGWMSQAPRSGGWEWPRERPDGDWSPQKRKNTVSQSVSLSV